MTRDEREGLAREALEAFLDDENCYRDQQTCAQQWPDQREMWCIVCMGNAALRVLASQPEEPKRQMCSRCYGYGTTVDGGRCPSCRPSQPEEEPGRAAAESWAASQRLADEQRYLAAARITARAAGLEHAADLLDERQAELARTLMNPPATMELANLAELLRALAEAKRGSGGGHA